MVQYDSYGNQRLRELANNNFTYLALIDDLGNEITRIDVTTDSRVVNEPDPRTNPLTYSVKISGTNNDITRPVTIAKTELYETSNGTTPVGMDTMVDAIIESPGDVVTVSHDQEIPQI